MFSMLNLFKLNFLLKTENKFTIYNVNINNFVRLSINTCFALIYNNLLKQEVNACKDYLQII